MDTASRLGSDPVSSYAARPSARPLAARPEPTIAPPGAANSSRAALQVCDSCHRHRIGEGPWRAGTTVRAESAGGAAASPSARLTTCRDCLAFAFPEYFAE